MNALEVCMDSQIIVLETQISVAVNAAEVGTLKHPDDRSILRMMTAAPSSELRPPPSPQVLTWERRHHNHSLTSPTMAGTPRIWKSPRCNSATHIQITQWNCWGFNARTKLADLRLFLTFENPPAVVVLQEPGSGPALTNYTTS